MNFIVKVVGRTYDHKFSFCGMVLQFVTVEPIANVHSTSCSVSKAYIFL